MTFLGTLVVTLVRTLIASLAGSLIISPVGTPMVTVTTTLTGTDDGNPCSNSHGTTFVGTAIISHRNRYRNLHKHPACKTALSSLHGVQQPRCGIHHLGVAAEIRRCDRWGEVLRGHFGVKGFYEGFRLCIGGLPSSCS